MRWEILITTLLLVPAAALAGCLGGEAPGQAIDPASENQTPLTQEDRPELQANGSEVPEPPPEEDWTGLQPIQMIFDGSLKHPLTRVLLVPPTHGDLTNPTNTSRSALSYLEATLQGIHNWETAIDLFVERYPAYAYLDEIDVQVEILDGQTPSAAGYDIIVGYAETSGPAFRGVAFGGTYDTQAVLDEAGLGELVHYGNRYILLSLFASAPRAGQDLPDYPETHEVEVVTMHEFAHTFGLGHTTTWTRAFGPDMMNSPYPLVYGDGDPAGDGGERSMYLCLNSLNIYGLAHLYRWMPNGTWEASHGNVSLPLDIPYEMYCPETLEMHSQGDWLGEVLAPGQDAWMSRLAAR